MKVAMYSGGKESIYAVLREWPVDVLLFLVYQFPRPSPHLLNFSKAVELGWGIAPVVVKKLQRGREFEEKVEFLKKLGTVEIVAGDVDVVEHLKYMERLASEVGARLREPLWGMDREELFFKIVEELDFVVIGASAPGLVCRRVSSKDAAEFLKEVKSLGVDPLGERGEYHSQVVQIHRLGLAIEARCREVVEHGGYYIALL